MIMEFFRPTKGKILLTILFLILMFVLLTPNACTLEALYCGNPEGGFGGKSAKSIPFSCDQTCSNSEFYLKTFQNTVLPLVVAYTLASSVIYLKNKIFHKE